MSIRSWLLRKLSLLAFNFPCDCGESVIAAVPRRDGDVIEVKCECGSSYILTWRGDRFTFKKFQVENQRAPFPIDTLLSPAMRRLVYGDKKQ